MGTKRRTITMSRAALALALAVLTGVPAGAAEKTKLKMIFWTFQAESVQAFVNEFMRRNPDIEVTLDGAPSAEYNAKAALMFRSGTPFDVMYIRDASLAQWAENGWAKPIDSCPGMEATKEDMLPLAKQMQSYKGKLYGLTYYATILPIIINKRMMKEAGFSEPPHTFEGWIEQAKEVKKRGLAEFPLSWPIRPTGWGSMYIWAGMTAAKGGKLFDDKFNVTPNGMWTLAWWRQTFKDGLSNPANIEWDNADVASVFMNGKSYMEWTQNIYVGNQFANNPEKSKVRGEAMLVDPPETGTTMGFSSMYGINAASKNFEAACKLVAFLGGKDEKGVYNTPKAWVEAAALTWGQRGVVNDPAVRASVQSWGGDPDKLEQSLEHAVAINDVVPFSTLWYFEWQEYADKLLQDILIGRISPEDGTAKMTERANQLARRYQTK
jgi:multiple sugar transport system substrate-binding protein